MEIRRLRYFVAVAEELHFKRAAERLGIKQPPLSAQIRVLEKEVGALLFHRRTRGVELTEAGALLLGEARVIVARAEGARTAVQCLVRGETGRMTIGFAGATYLVSLLPDIVRAYRAKYPKVTLHLEQSNTLSLVDALRAGRVDVAFVRPPIADRKDVTIEPVIEEETLAVLPHGHRLHDAGSVTLAELTHETLIMAPREFAPGYYDGVIAALHAAGSRPTLGQEASQIVSIPPMVVAGFGIAIVPRSMSQLRIDHVAYVPISGIAPRASIAFAYRSRDRTPTVRSFVAIALDVIRGSRTEQPPPVGP